MSPWLPDTKGTALTDMKVNTASVKIILMKCMLIMDKIGLQNCLEIDK